MERNNGQPKISVIVPAYNASQTIDKCIRSLLSQTYKNREIIIVDDCSKDNTFELIKAYPVKLLQTPENSGAGGARNVGIENAEGEIIAFTDSDCFVPKNWLGEIVKTFQNFPTAGSVGGATLNPNDNIMSWADYFLNFSEQLPAGAIVEKNTIPTLNVAYKKEALGALRFLPMSNSEDTILNHQFRQKGSRIIFNPDIRVFHNHTRYNLKSLFKAQKLYGEKFVYSRSHYDLPGKALLKYKFIFLFFPRLLLIAKRVIKARFFTRFLLAFPVIFLGELARIVGILSYSEDKQ